MYLWSWWPGPWAGDIAYLDNRYYTIEKLDKECYFPKIKNISIQIDKENTELFYEYKLLISKLKKITHFLFIVIKYWCIYAMYLF